MATRVLSEAAGKQIVDLVRSGYGASLAISGLQIQLKNGQASPAIIGTATIPTATQSAGGAMSPTDKAKLDGIATGANAYVLPTAGTALGGVKTTSTVTSATGYTPAPIIDGVPYYKDTNTTYAAASTSAAGLMSAADKVKLNGIATGATRVTVDSAMSSTSANPVQNKTVKSALDAKAPLASPALTGTPTAPTAATSTSTTQVATTAFVQAVVANAVTSAMTYKGAAAAYTDITGTDYKPGWCWVVSATGTFAGQACEAGDMVVANTAKASAGAADTDFDVIQSNVAYVTADDVKAWFA
ncbi:MAG: head fiber protein [Parafannyhessea sp.]|uniref:head fiber protein n=1 Tax=Parafannyhessea sp. TaxID=2847324 RepID=UPI003EFED1EC